MFSQNAQRPFSANITLDGKDRPMSDLPPTEYHLDGCSKAAAAIIERYKDQPFFLDLAYRGPHTPLDAPKRYMDRFPGEMTERRRTALAMLSAIDDGVGLITSTLKKHGLTEKTLIFFIGDNGAPLKIHKVDSPLQGYWRLGRQPEHTAEWRKRHAGRRRHVHALSHRLAWHDPWWSGL